MKYNNEQYISSLEIILMENRHLLDCAEMMWRLVMLEGHGGLRRTSLAFQGPLGLCEPVRERFTY